MNVKQLIKLLKNCDPNSHIRTVKEFEEDLDNQWVCDLEESRQGESGYEYGGEIRLLTVE